MWIKCAICNANIDKRERWLLAMNRACTANVSFVTVNYNRHAVLWSYEFTERCHELQDLMLDIHVLGNYFENHKSGSMTFAYVLNKSVPQGFLPTFRSVSTISSRFGELFRPYGTSPTPANKTSVTENPYTRHIFHE